MERHCHLLKKPMWPIGTLLCASMISWVPCSAADTSSDKPEEKRLIGPTTVVAETETELNFKARVDTGATTSSLHVEEWAIEDESSTMENNVGKTIRFRVKNHRGESEWLERTIVEISLIKTSEQEEQRYKVPMDLRWNDVTKRVLVSLNDRSHMKYSLLLGRNFLQGDFVVDVDLKKKSSAAAIRPPKKAVKAREVSTDDTLETATGADH